MNEDCLVRLGGGLTDLGWNVAGGPGSDSSCLEFIGTGTELPTLQGLYREADAGASLPLGSGPGSCPGELGWVEWTRSSGTPYEPF